MRVDALFRLLQVQFMLVVPSVVPHLQAAPTISRSLPKSGLLVYLDKARGRLGEASVMSLKSPQYAAHRLVALRTPHQRRRNVAPRLHDDRDDDVAEPLARRLAHHAPHGLHHIDLAVAGIKESDRIERRHVHTFREQLDVADYPAFAVAVGSTEGAKLLVAL